MLNVRVENKNRSEKINNVWARILGKGVSLVFRFRHLNYIVFVFRFGYSYDMTRGTFWRNLKKSSRLSKLFSSPPFSFFVPDFTSINCIKEFGKHIVMVSGGKHNRKLVKLLDYSELVSYKYLPKMIKIPCKSISSKGSVQKRGFFFNIQGSKLSMRILRAANLPREEHLFKLLQLGPYTAMLKWFGENLT